jgi:hypothetical protein
MSISMYNSSVPVIIRGLGILSAYLDKAKAFAAENKIDPSILVNARLAPDMMSLAGQVQRASDKGKGGVSRLTGVAVPAFADTETTFEELKERITKTVSLLETFTPAQFEGSEDRPVEMTLRSLSGTFRGEAYLLSVLLPDFFFHIATAHGILRHNGLKIGKKDYYGYSTSRHALVLRCNQNAQNVDGPRGPALGC